MLFDLEGKRRRVIQATYLLLAILMGGGLVLFGIGSDVQGGLADIFTSGEGGSADEEAEDRLEDAEARLEQNPNDLDALAQLAAANFQLALSTDSQSGATFAEDAQPRLEAADDAWTRYLEADPEEPDDVLAFNLLTVYGQQGLNDPAKAAEAAQIVAAERETTQAFFTLAQLSAQAGDERQAELAGRRAVQLAPEPQRQQLQRQIDAAIASASAMQEGAAPGGVPPDALPGGEGSGGGGG